MNDNPQNPNDPKLAVADLTFRMDCLESRLAMQEGFITGYTSAPPPQPDTYLIYMAFVAGMVLGVLYIRAQMAHLGESNV